MFKHKISDSVPKSDFIISLLYMIYIMLVISSIMLFKEMIHLKIYLINYDLAFSGALIPYVFLYPVSFVVLKIYGLRHVNCMVMSMVVVSFLYTVLCNSVLFFADISPYSELSAILHSSIKMYIAGLFAMPAGIYSSFLFIFLLSKININFNMFSLVAATLFGEAINTLIVFPIGMTGQANLAFILTHIIPDAFLFKIIAGIVLTPFTIFTINVLIKKYIHAERSRNG